VATAPATPAERAAPTTEELVALIEQVVAR
jgi:hypothetical protein